MHSNKPQRTTLTPQRTLEQNNNSTELAQIFYRLLETRTKPQRTKINRTTDTSQLTI